MAALMKSALKIPAWVWVVVYISGRLGLIRIHKISSSCAPTAGNVHEVYAHASP
jgi:hypothetical protein